jgi:hypothetical protein
LACHRAQDLHRREADQRALALFIGNAVADIGDAERDNAARTSPRDRAQHDQHVERRGKRASPRGQGCRQSGGGDRLRLAPAVADAPGHELHAAIGDRIGRDHDADGTRQRAEALGQIRQQRIDRPQRCRTCHRAHQHADQGGPGFHESCARMSAERSQRLGWMAAA